MTTLLSILDELNLLPVEMVVHELYFTFWKEERFINLNALENGNGEYIVNIEKDGSNWIIYAEEHEPRDIESMGIKSVHKTLSKAKESAIEFARFFQECTWNNERDSDPDD